VQEVLSGMPKRYSEHVIDEVFFAIEQNQDLLRRYETLSATLGMRLGRELFAARAGRARVMKVRAPTKVRSGI
jgi:hypothetical protein